MAFDISTAKPINQQVKKGFDISTAMPVNQAANFGTNGSIEDIPGYSPPPNPIKDSSSFADKIIGAGEAGIATALGGPLATAGQVLGSVKGISQSVANGTYGTQQGADSAEQEANKYASMGAGVFAPSTTKGKEYLQNISTAAEPIAGLAPFTQEASIIGQSAKAALPMARSTIAEGLAASNKITADEAALMPETRNQGIINKIKEGSNENSLAPYDVKVANPNLKDNKGNLLPQAYKLVDDNEANAAINQGWEKGTIQAVKNFDKKTTDTAKEMIDISKKGSLDDTYRAENRPIMAIGQPMADQLLHIKSVKKSAGQELNRIVNEDLINQPIDITPATNDFINRLQSDLGVKIKPNANGLKIDFNGSSLEGYQGNILSVQNIIKTIANRAYNAKNTSAKGAHDFKNFIDNQVKYGAGLEGLSGQVDNIVKGLRHDIDNTLDANFPEYDHVNKVYSETKNAIDNVQKLAGKNIDLEKDYSPQALGKLSRTILSNNKSAEKVADVLNNLDDVSANYGGERTGKLKALVRFSTTLDKQFGAAADTSLLGELQSALSPSAKDSTVGVLKTLGKKALGKNQENAYKAMQDLLDKQAIKNKTEGSL